ncbi:MAG TPA: MFS transporter, partial [Leptospiraceae bacterium]|nr:MFS transporter [Leptospiraceae bacterium]
MNILINLMAAVLLFGFAYIIWNYAKGLKDSPREIWILFGAKLIEYAAYGASNMTFVLYLSEDCGLGDVEAGSYIGTWSTLLTCFSILVGSVVDAVGIRKTLVIGMTFLLIGRFVMPFTSNLWTATFFAFIPVAAGNALLGPVLSVGIKKFTTKTSSTLGFGLFYTLMNTGFALGGYIFDKTRSVIGEHSSVKIPLFQINMSTYQIIFAVSFLLSVPTLLLILLMREGVQMKEDGSIVADTSVSSGKGTFSEILPAVKKTGVDTFIIMKNVFTERPFWVYLFMLGILVFIRLVFYHFHYTFPKYGIRILGEGVKIGNIYGILNPVLIIFLVPVIAHLTKEVRSYTMLTFGTAVSALSIFIAALPPSLFSPFTKTWIGDLIFIRWLELGPDKENPIIFGLILFVIIFTIGEAIWSPRLFQFSAEIAPEGKEGTYLALSYLPYFLAKMIAGPLSGWLISKYAPANASSYPDQHMIWIWIGTMSVLSPAGLLLFRNT